MGILDHIAKEWGVLKSAPLAFVVLLFSGLGGGFYLNGLLTAERIETMHAIIDKKNEEIKAKDGEIDDYRKNLDKRLQDVEQKLSQKQISDILNTLKGAPSIARIYVNEQIPPQNNILLDMKGFFYEGGWTIETVDPAKFEPGVFGSIEVTGEADAKTIATVLNEAGLKYEAFESPKVEPTTQFVIKASD